MYIWKTRIHWSRVWLQTPHTPPPQNFYDCHVTRIYFWFLLHGPFFRGAVLHSPCIFILQPKQKERCCLEKCPLPWWKGWVRVLVEHPSRGRGANTALSHEFIASRQTCHTAKPEYCGTGLYHPLTKNKEWTLVSSNTTAHSNLLDESKLRLVIIIIIF